LVFFIFSIIVGIIIEKEIKFIGIDYSLSKTGLVILCPDGRYEASLIKVTGKGIKRTKDLADTIVDTCGERNIIMIEDVFAGRSPGNAMKIAKGWGMIVCSLINNGNTVISMPPSRLRSFIHKGNLGKWKEYIPRVRKQWNVDEYQEDIVAAYALARAAMLWEINRVRPTAIKLISKGLSKKFTPQQVLVIKRQFDLYE